MPGVLTPNEQWLANQLASLQADLKALKAQQTQFVVDASGVAQAIIGNLAFDPKGNATGLSGFGIATWNGTGWHSLKLVETAITPSGGDDTAALQAAINQATALTQSNTPGGGGEVCLIPKPGLPFNITSTIALPSNIVIRGLGPYVEINWSAGSGALFELANTAGARGSYVTLEKLLLQAGSRRPAGSIAIDAHYTDVITLRDVRINQFATGINLDNCTGLKAYRVSLYDNTVGELIGASCGGHHWYGGAFDSNQLALHIAGAGVTTAGHNLAWNGIEIDTDGNGLNGAASVGAILIDTNGGNCIAFRDISTFTQAIPSQGASAIVTGTASDVLFDNCYFEGQAHSPAAIKVDAASFVSHKLGRTFGHSTSSYIVTANALSVRRDLTDNQEGTLVTGGGGIQTAQYA